MTAHDFIWKRLKEANLVFEAEQYITDMHYEKIRICNDGFPDARSPLTNGYSVRQKIAGYRQVYGQMHPHAMHVNNRKNYTKAYDAGYDKALNDIVPTYKQRLSSCSLTDRISKLRDIVRERSENI